LCRVRGCMVTSCSTRRASIRSVVVHPPPSLLCFRRQVGSKTYRSFLHSVAIVITSSSSPPHLVTTHPSMMTTPQQTLAVSPLGVTRRALADISQWNTFIRFLSPAHTLTADEIILLDTCGFLHITDRHCRCHTPSHPLRLTAGDEPDGFHLRCPVGGTRTYVSIRADSYFSH
jgi:hypothetical protein